MVLSSKNSSDPNMNNTITVVIPTYNKADFISQTIESVLQQTYENFEIVIIDDCSGDKTEQVVQKYLSEKIRYFKHSKNLGPGATFNDGIKKSNTDYITLIASDDILLPNHLELVINTFESDKELEVLFPQLKVINERNEDLKQIIRAPFDDKYKLLNHLFYQGNDIPSPGIAFRKRMFKKISPYNTNLILVHDYDLNVRCLMQTKVLTLPIATVLYRKFSNNANLSGNTEWYKLCRKIELKTVLNNYLNIRHDEMVQIFPQFRQCNKNEIEIKLLLETCKNSYAELSSWAFENIIEYLNKNKDFFETNNLNFQYKDYIQLYKTYSTKNTELSHKRRLYNKLRNIIKLLFGIR